MEYLFRGKRADNGEWALSSLWYATIHSGVVGYDFEPDTIGQFSGMVDKNETKIFENDIIEARPKGIEEVIEEDDVYRFVCKFGMCGGVKNTLGNVGYMGFYFEPADKVTKKCARLALRDDPIYWLNENDCYIIGNTTDNPELMEDDDEGKSS